MNFWVKTSRLVKFLFPKYIWDIPNNANKVYLTFDDGPTPEITEWVLQQLKRYNAKATFFCIGKNIDKYPHIFDRLISEGHEGGNHTFDHIKGWKTSKDLYIENTVRCQLSISKRYSANSNLFRPPYGKIKNSQAKALRNLGYRIIMWDLISMDFDKEISSEECLSNVLLNLTTGSIIVFHDSVKAKEHLQCVLPKTLAYLQESGFTCASINY